MNESTTREFVAAESSTKPKLTDVAMAAFGFFALTGPSFIATDMYWRQSVALGLTCMYFVMHSRRYEARGGLPHVMLLAFGVLCIVSVIWSVQPTDTAGAVANMFLAIWFARLCATRLDGQSVLMAIIIATLLACGMSIMLVYYDSSFAVVQQGYQAGAVKGIYVHRNHLGYVGAIGGIAAFGASLFAERNRVVFVVAFITCSYVAVRAASVSAIVCLMLALVLVAVLRMLVGVSPRQRGALASVAFLAATVSGAVVILQADTWLELFGRDTSLTGRTAIWPAVLAAWREHPVLGYGWNATWGDDAAVQQTISSAVGFRVHHAHNSFLDILLQVGAVGLLMIVVALFSLVIYVFIRFSKDPDAGAFLVTSIGVLFVLISYSLVEDRLSKPFGIAILVLLASKIGKRRLPAKKPG